MSLRRTARSAAAVVVITLTAACGTDEAIRATSRPVTSTTASTTTTAGPPRTVTEEAWTPFATVGGVILTHPSSRVERVAFHQSAHDGARQLTALPSAVARPPSRIESGTPAGRGRPTWWSTRPPRSGHR